MKKPLVKSDRKHGSRGRRGRVLLTLAALCICCAGPARAADIAVSGGWSRTFGASDLQSGAGSGLIGNYESASDAVTIDVTVVGSTRWWVYVKKIDSSWPAGLGLFVRRTSNGTGVGRIGLGTAYQEVTDTSEGFFRGDYSRSNISVQLGLQPMSLQIPPGRYNTTVYFTVTE